MRVAISGSSGFIGTALLGSLRGGGHDVLRLVRRPPTAPDEISWDPVVGDLDPRRLEGVEAVINLNGESLGNRRWTRSFKRLIHDSRTRTTAVLATALAGLSNPPRVLVSASGVNVYGNDRGRDRIDEDYPAGEDFLSTLCVDWEAATAPARAAGIAVCHPRFGIVIGHGGGALGRMLPLFRLGLGGTLGGGEQYWSPVSLTDAVRALQFLIEEHGCVGAYNVTAPAPVTNAEFSRVLAHALNRPMLLPAPGFGLRLVLGEYAQVVTGSLRVLPTRLLDSGFVHDHPDTRAIIAAGLPG